MIDRKRLIHIKFTGLGFFIRIKAVEIFGWFRSLKSFQLFTDIVEAGWFLGLVEEGRNLGSLPVDDAYNFRWVIGVHENVFAMEIAMPETG